MEIFFIDQVLEIIALGLMFYSVYLQLKFIKFKRKCTTTTGKVSKLSQGFLWQKLKVEFLHKEKIQEYKLFLMGFQKEFEEEQEILYHPDEINLTDSSVIISPLLKKIHLYRAPRKMIFLKKQNPTVMYISLMFFALILLGAS